MSAFKVYGWQGHRSDCKPGTNRSQQTREIVAAKSKAAACRAYAATDYSRPKRPSAMFNLCETGNSEELSTALASPGAVFWRSIDTRTGGWKKARLRESVSRAAKGGE